MNEFTQGILAALLPALSVSILTSYVTVKLSMKQFYSQKWWEKKAEAYSNIIEQLSYLQYYFGEWLDEGVGMKELSDEDRKRLKQGYGQAKEYITKAAAIGAYIVSNNTAKTLEEIVRSLEQNTHGEDWVSDINTKYGLVEKSITKIREFAKKDML